MSTVTIYSMPGSPFLAAALYVLEERQVPYSLVPWKQADLRTDAHLALHPFGRMPVLDHDGFKLYETQAILRYVADAFPGEPLVPRDVRRRARMDAAHGHKRLVFLSEVYLDRCVGARYQAAGHRPASRSCGH